MSGRPVHGWFTLRLVIATVRGLGKKQFPRLDNAYFNRDGEQAGVPTGPLLGKLFTMPDSASSLELSMAADAESKAYHSRYNFEYGAVLQLPPLRLGSGKELPGQPLPILLFNNAKASFQQ